MSYEETGANEDKQLIMSSEQPKQNENAKSAKCVMNSIGFSVGLMCCIIPPLCIALAYKNAGRSTPPTAVIIGCILAIVGFFLGIFLGVALGIRCARYVCGFSDADIEAGAKLPNGTYANGKPRLC